MKQAKQLCFVSTFINFRNITTIIWNTIKKIYKHNEESNTNYIYVMANRICGPKEITETFNEFYINIAPK